MFGRFQLTGFPKSLLYGVKMVVDRLRKGGTDAVDFANFFDRRIFNAPNAAKMPQQVPSSLRTNASNTPVSYTHLTLPTRG